MPPLEERPCTVSCINATHDSKGQDDTYLKYDNTGEDTHLEYDYSDNFIWSTFIPHGSDRDDASAVNYGEKVGENKGYETTTKKCEDETSTAANGQIIEENSFHSKLPENHNYLVTQDYSSTWHHSYTHGDSFNTHTPMGTLNPTNINTIPIPSTTLNSNLLSITNRFRTVTDPTFNHKSTYYHTHLWGNSIPKACIKDASKLCRLPVLKRYCNLPGYRKLCCVTCLKLDDT